MAYWNRYNDQDNQDERDRDFESGEYYNRGGFSRGDYDRTDQRRRGSGRDTGRSSDRERGAQQGNARTFTSRNRDRNNLAHDYDAFGEQYGENYRTWGNADRDWDYGYPRDYGQNRDVRRDYQSDRENYNRQRDWDRSGDRGQDRGRYQRDQFNRYNASGYNNDEEYYGLGYRPTNYNPHHPGQMPGREIPAGGMQSDFNADVEYDNPGSGRSNYARGDAGYDSEGAFYQDMDEPVSREILPSWRQRGGRRNEMNYRERGQHAGKGPANYRRSDSRIEEDICERLTRHGRIDASDIEVTVDNGVAILKGSVPRREMKRLAEDVADDVTGVKDVENVIKVNRPQPWNQGQPGARARDWENRAERSPAGQSNVGAGLTSEGATSLSGMEAANEADENRHGLREGMEVIGKDGVLLGRVKEIREGDFLLSRSLARDLYVPYSALESVAAQAMLKIASDDIGKQNWEKPNLL